ncbi:hypothetical protein REMIM1_PE00358 (plasmid) [Rhizobium etli bv. mimosae str. Mim1]|nr:hypothetical protein REMIM1_PE00358 [Rhizobium etli bv. mimosae str. Mim1]
MLDCSAILLAVFELATDVGWNKWVWQGTTATLLVGSMAATVVAESIDPGAALCPWVGLIGQGRH